MNDGLPASETESEALAFCARACPTHPAIISKAVSLSYAGLSGAVNASAVNLWALGVAEGDRVVLAAPNSADWIVAAHACMQLGAVVCPLDPCLPIPELHQRLVLLEPRLLLGTSDLIESGPKNPSFQCLKLSDAGTSLTQAPLDQRELSPHNPNWPGCDPGRLTAILLTSGSSGEPKGVALTSRNLTSAAKSHLAHFGIAFGSTRWLVNLPLHHIGGFVVLFRALQSGGTIIVQGGFEAGETAEAIEREHATHLSLVSTTLRRLLDAHHERALFQEVCAVLIGGGSCPAGLLNEARLAGMPVCPTYGMTEACSQIATSLPDDPPETLGVVAPLIPDMEVEIRDESGNRLPDGTEGEIYIRGPMVAESYWHGNSRLVPATRDGWLRTADIGVLSHGRYLQVLGRRDDAIVSGGEKIHPLEVEQALLAIPGITRAVVVGEDDSEWGQAPVAVVQSVTQIDSDAIRELLRPRLAKFKIPKRIVSLTKWPDQALGKVRRRDLLEVLRGK
jgi:O-succinylbenzoic acid--CoA ligase